jgi:hypothetical protein
LISTSDGLQPIYGGGASDAFIAKFDNNGMRIWGTYFGGSGDDIGYGISFDFSQGIYFSGQTNSPNLNNSVPIAKGYQHTIGGGKDAYLVKIDLDGKPVWGTYYGGLNDDLGYSVACDVYGNAYLIGCALSNAAISSSDSYSPVFNGGTNDVFFVKFNPLGQRLWGSYYGGSLDDKGIGITVDNHSYIYICGSSSSQNGIASSGAHQIDNNGLDDAYVAKFLDSLNIRPADTVKSEVLVYLPDTTTVPNVDNFKIPLKIRGLSANIAPKDYPFSCEIKFEYSAFLPKSLKPSDFTLNEIINHDRVIRFNGLLYSIPNQDTVIAEIIGLTLTANMHLTPLYISNFSFTDTNIKVIVINGSLFIQFCTLPLIILHDLSPTTLQIMPNPASDNEIEIVFEGEEVGLHTLNIYNIQGIIVDSREWINEKNSRRTIVLDTKNFPDGVYEVVLKSPMNIISKKLMVLK